MREMQHAVIVFMGEMQHELLSSQARCNMYSLSLWCSCPPERHAACSYRPYERDAASSRPHERAAACSHCPCVQHAVSSLLKSCSMQPLSLWETCFFWGLISQDSWLVYCFSTFAQIIQHHFSQELLCQTLHFWNWIKVFLLVQSGVICLLFVWFCVKVSVA